MLHSTARTVAQDSDRKRDFFISYTNSDRGWAEWIAWQLDEAGYAVTLQAWDFHAGSNFAGWLPPVWLVA
jgi:TIR domain